VTAVAADSSGDAWCIVQARDQKSFCHLTPGSSRWAVLKTVSVGAPGSGRIPDPPSNGMDPLIAVSPSSIVFTLGITWADNTAAAYRWHRGSGKMENIAWEAGMRAANPRLFVTLSAIDGRTKGLWLGTSAGLLYCDLRPGEGAGEWKRVLPEEQIDVGAGARDGGVWVVTRPRSVAARTRYGNADWKLQRVLVPLAEKVQDIPVPLLPDLRSAEEKRRGITVNKPNNSVPVAVTLQKNGDLWLTQSGAGYYRSPLPATRNAWLRRDPVTTAWTRYERVESGAEEAITSSLRETPPLGKSRNHASLDLLPDAAVVPLALYPLSEEDGMERRKEYGSYGNMDFNNLNLSSPRIGYWVRSRFRDWMCPDDAPEEMRTFSAPSSIKSFGDDSLPFPAPADKVWAFDRANATLLWLPFSTLQKVGNKEGDSSWRIDDPEALTGPDIESFPAPGNRSVRLRPSIRSMLAERQGGNEDTSKLYVLTVDNKLFSYDTRSGVFSSIPVPEANNIAASDYPFYRIPTSMFPCYSGGVFLTVPRDGKVILLRYDPKDKSVSTLAELGNGKQFLGAAPNDGLWFLQNIEAGIGLEMRFQPPGATASQPLPKFSSGDSRRGDARASFQTGYISWTMISSDELVGYDIERKRWTRHFINPYLRHLDRSREQVVLDDNRGGIFFVNPDYTSAAVYHYDRERDLWEIAAPWLPRNLDQGVPNLVLASANEKEVWLIVDDSYLICYNRVLKFWGRQYPLPDAVRGRETYQNGIKIIATENNSDFYFGQPSGLWRFSPKTGVWTEQWQNASFTPEGVPQSRMYLRASVGEERGRADSYYTVLGVGNQTVAAGFNRITGVWSFFDAANGFPVRGGGRTFAAGEGAWLTNGSQTYFLDEKTGVCRLVFAASPDHEPPGLFGGSPVDWFLELMKDQPKVKPEQSIEVAKTTTDRRTGDTLILGTPRSPNPETRLLLLRFDKNGREIGRSPAPYSLRGGPGVYSLLAHNGYFLIATSAGIFRTEGRGRSRWVKVSPPPGLSVSPAPTNLRNAAGRPGFYVITDESIAYWR
jgi:hypothetical protein